MREENLWLNRPLADYSADEWAGVAEQIIDIYLSQRSAERSNELLRFVLKDATGRCVLEAENRKPGITEERVKALERWLEQQEPGTDEE